MESTLPGKIFIIRTFSVPRTIHTNKKETDLEHRPNIWRTLTATADFPPEGTVMEHTSIKHRGRSNCKWRDSGTIRQTIRRLQGADAWIRKRHHIAVAGSPGGFE